MRSTMAATVVTPLLAQNDDWLKRCLESVFAQTVPTAAIVVTSPHTPPSNLAVLDGLANRHPELEYIERAPGGGFADAINAGFEHAETVTAGLLLSDDWLAPDAVEMCMRREADIVVTGRRAYAGDGRTPLWERIPEAHVFANLSTLEERAAYLGHFFLFRRDQVLLAGGVDPNIGLTGADDYDLPWTLMERGASVSLVEKVLYFYRDHEDTRLTLRDRRQQIGDLRLVLSKHGLNETEIECLIAEKQKWYGVPCYRAIEDPDWFLREEHSPED